MTKFKVVSLATLAACAAASSAQELQGTDVLNFALNLECLEAEFYSWAAFGRGLSEERRAGGPPSVGGRKANLSDPVQQLAEEIANDEIAHVDFFRAALGDAAVPCPKIDIGPAFAAAANAATGMELDPTFDPYANDLFFLHGAFVFEDVGVTAFRGAVEPLVPLVEPSVLSAAAAVLGVEAYHAGAIRTLLSELNNQGVETPFGPIETVVGAISDLRDSVDGDDDLDQGIVDANGRTNIVPTDENSLVYSRTVDQVLPIVYLGPEPGGFLPEGVNGFFGPNGATATDDDDDDEQDDDEKEGKMSKMGQAASCTGKCEYRMTVDMQWNAVNHPIDYPANGKFSPFYSLFHDKSFVLWREGETANNATKQIAETGDGDNFRQMVEQCGDSCGQPLELMCEPESGTCTGTGTLKAAGKYPYFSTASMHAPSPDWFTGVDTWNLCDTKTGQWKQMMQADVNAYDAGTDTGPAFMSEDMPQEKRSPIFSFGAVMPPTASVFYNPSKMEILPVGNIKVELVGCE